MCMAIFVSPYKFAITVLFTGTKMRFGRVETSTKALASNRAKLYP
jgi:hypothetical protein